ncbi:hypothetical protein Glove_16g214 [Diversispora epigaea]|uniref:Uncharacterized protein n=1 Tax=Diversispora epigaea TaxID=1348612 RepID=A0A397JXU4_9GLOM|nr:hypothetical protein Glove_16g214 [Diversispora epigaea]
MDLDFLFFVSFTTTGIEISLSGLDKNGFQLAGDSLTALDRMVLRNSISNISNNIGNISNISNNIGNIDNIVTPLVGYNNVKGRRRNEKTDYVYKLTGYQLGSTREIELEEALHDSCKINSKLIDDFKNYRKIQSNFNKNIKEENIRLYHNLKQTDTNIHSHT